MEQASYKAPSQAFQLNIPHGYRDAALAADPDPSRRGNHPWHSPPSHATPPAAVNPGQHEEAQQGEVIGNRQGQQQQAQADNVACFLQWCNRAGRGRRQQWKQQHRRKLKQREREKDLMEQDPCASSSNGCGRQGSQCRSPVHRPHHEQPGEARWRGRNRRRNQRRRQCIKTFHQVQASGQSSCGQEELLFWNVKKHCWVTTLHIPAVMLRETHARLRPMNMAGYCLPGMCVPHNTSQYIMDQHEYTWRNEEEAAEAISGGNSNYSTEDEDFALMVPLPSTVQEDEGTSTEEEDESTQPACQG